MHVVIAGGHGKIALRLERLLVARGDSVTGLIRRAEQAFDLEALGTRPVVCDLETIPAEDLAGHLRGADAVVFAAGAGPASGSGRKDSVDRGAAALLADGAELAGIRRYLMISTMGLDRAGVPGMDEEFSAYLRAKAAAEDDLRARALDWTVLRPGPLTDDAGTGLVRLAQPPLPLGSVPRDDVAHVLLALLDAPESAGLTLELTSGAVFAADAVRDVLVAR
ncbi:NAD(P)H-binding protein [Kitasatospora atroaurantiaca]|uniref:Putative NADH-flavin reductase n=1 Tax=Kitasatospora atroaurantiaca TaxID=285545 RepID=A0A561EK40_9ACTN|nr:SDR family oxidoreductase [Kitasatospora atroaurantiaca]TWE15971.1 putative NADH-flavin reductase [Kitasatospora atroaurantiaca]